MPNTPPTRIEALRSLLKQGELSTQDELRDKLQKLRFSVTQSTVSRDLRKIGAIKAIDGSGQTVYRLPEEPAPFSTPATTRSLADLVFEIRSNGSLIVISASPGSASLIARHLDQRRPEDILGTIAGDDTIFVAPASSKRIKATIQAIRDSLSYT